MTKAEALALALHQTIYHTSLKNADGSALRARVNGKPVVKARSGAWYIPLKHGLKTCFYLDDQNITNWLLDAPAK
jgi:hypothetical protein